MAGLSVKANVGAFVALQNRTKTTKQLEQTQLQITTGLRVNGPKDDSSNFSIATRLRSDIAGTGAATASIQINSAIVQVSDKLAALGSSAKRIEVQSEFTQQLIDILKEGLGNLVDADLAEESASLQALQIKQQLGGVQALAIANAGPQSILALFQ